MVYRAKSNISASKKCYLEGVQGGRRDVQTQDVDLTVGVDGPEELPALVHHQAQGHISAFLAARVVAEDLEGNPAVSGGIIGGRSANTFGIGGERAAPENQVARRGVAKLAEVRD